MLRSFGLPELIILAIILIIAVKALRSRSVRGVVLGAILGAIVGFLLRPSVPLVGQLPFPVVITRGANLSGLDIILRSVAKQSFNYMMVGAIVGAIVLGAWVSMTRKPSPTAPLLPRPYRLRLPTRLQAPRAANFVPDAERLWAAILYFVVLVALVVAKLA
jgi:hypothetical protein